MKPSLCLSIIVAALVPLTLGAQPVRALDIARLSTDTDLLRMLGSVGDGRFGVPVAGGLDLNGDSSPDYVMAAFQASPLGRSLAGTVFVYFGDGGLSGLVDTADQRSDLLRIHGAAPRETAGSEVWVADVTGDGVADLLIGRQNYSPDASRPGAGALTILVGGQALSVQAASGPVDLANPPAGLTVFTIHGAGNSDRLGIWMRTGDVTGDGIPDILVGADQQSAHGEMDAGVAYLIRGGPHLAATAAVDLAQFGSSALAGNLLRILPPSGAENFHTGAVCQLADLDANGRSEVLLGAALNRAGASIAAVDGRAEGSGGPPGGRMFIVWDDNFPNPWPAGLTIDLDAAPGAITSISGGQRSNVFGEELSGGVDFNADGSPDLFVGDIVGDFRDDDDNDRSGSGHVLFSAPLMRGQSFTLDQPPSGVAVTTISGAGRNDIAGDTAVVGDFNADGIADLATSGPHANALGRVEAGVFYVLYGRAGGWPATVDLRPDRLPAAADLSMALIYGAKGVSGADRGDVLGYSAAALDIDGDGFTDLIANEMTGNGSAPEAQDSGNLIVLSGALIACQGAACPGEIETTRKPGGGSGSAGWLLFALGAIGGLRTSRRRRA